MTIKISIYWALISRPMVLGRWSSLGIPRTGVVHLLRGGIFSLWSGWLRSKLCGSHYFRHMSKSLPHMKPATAFQVCYEMRYRWRGVSCSTRKDEELGWTQCWPGRYRCLEANSCQVTRQYCWLSKNFLRGLCWHRRDCFATERAAAACRL